MTAINRATASIWCLAFLTIGSLTFGSVAAWAEPVDDELLAAESHFTLLVLPVLQEKCFACHGEEATERKGELTLTSRAAMLVGGESEEPTIIPGHASESILVEAIRWEGYEMPPKENDRLTQEQIAAVERWIDAGAVWPDETRQEEIRIEARSIEETVEGIVVKTSGGLSDDWTYRRYQRENLWAYQPLETPSSLAPDADVNLVDHFVNSHLEQASLPPAPQAEPRDLIRRLTFDLIGLPPTPTEVNAFLSAWQADPDQAWQTAVDRLLASPHYGEQAARHWLDVVRYADSAGFSNDWERPTAWRYRDYVIRSFNNDKPYDQFVREQLAGDELAPEDSEMQVAVGFLRMGPWEHSTMSVAKETRQQYLDDVTDAVGQVFLAHPLQCAKCHDHKFDPVPTRDYYSLQAVFATTQLADVDTEWLPEENLDGMEEDRKLHEQKLGDITAKYAGYRKKIEEEEARWFAERGLPYESRDEAKKAGAPPEHIPEYRVGLTPNDLGGNRIAKKWRQRYGWEQTRYEPVALGVYNGKTNLKNGYNGRRPVPDDPLAAGAFDQSAILTGGSPYTPGERVTPGVLSVVAGEPGACKIPAEVSGRRTALAGWIASEANPLTARVMVNRIWQTHFGRGLVGTPNNFGAMGKKPTHPKLLDALAARFVEEGWSIKKLHRLILTSQAYRRSTHHPDSQQLQQIDPARDLYAVFQPRRLTAEELRDAMLHLSDELNRQQGGIAARPDINLEAALQPRMIMGTFAPAYVPNARPEQRNRRTIYTIKLRGQRDPFMEVFNQPTPDISCELRDQSNVTPQVFSMFNSQETAERALALAKRVLTKIEGNAADLTADETAIERLFDLVYHRLPTDQEQQASLKHWQTMQAVEAKLKPKPREYPTQITRRANEENSGQPFELTERLYEYEHYVPDVEPHMVDARTRGFADLCLVLLNSNEFVYVY